MDDAGLPFRVVRRPGFLQLLRLFRFADVIHLAGPALLPLGLAWMLRKPTVLEHHGYQSICPNGLLIFQPDHSICPGHFMARHYSKCVQCNAEKWGRIKSLQNLVLTFPRRWLCRRVACNVAVSDHVARRIALPRTRTIHHGIPDSGFYVQLDSRDSREPLRIGYVGRLVEEKGLQVLLEAVGRLNREGYSFQLDIVGDGPLRDELQIQTHRLQLESRVAFLGSLTGGDLHRARAAFSLLVMPSVLEETAGLVAIEQMIGGGVVLASDIGGLSEIVGDGGLKFVPGDSTDLYRQLRQVIETPALSERISAAARARAMQLFRCDSMIEAHAALYREMLCS
jgi:glycosyltransferase involved in cell wall biosynthesis